MTIRQITIFLVIQQQGIKRDSRLAQPGRGHGRQRIVPSPGLVPLPFLHDPFQRAAHRFAVDVFAGKHSQRAQHRRMIVISFGECLRAVLMRQVNALPNRQSRELIDDPLPDRVSLKAEPLPPIVGDVQPP